MLINVDIPCLCKMLCALEPYQDAYSANTQDLTIGNEYLFFDVLLPLIKKEDIYLSQIDYDEFDLDDLRKSCYFAECADKKIQLVCDMMESLQREKPKVYSEKTYL